MTPGTQAEVPGPKVSKRVRKALQSQQWSSHWGMCTLRDTERLFLKVGGRVTLKGMSFQSVIFHKDDPLPDSASSFVVTTGLPFYNRKVWCCSPVFPVLFQVPSHLWEIRCGHTTCFGQWDMSKNVSLLGGSTSEPAYDSLSSLLSPWWLMTSQMVESGSLSDDGMGQKAQLTGDGHGPWVVVEVEGKLTSVGLSNEILRLLITTG